MSLTEREADLDLRARYIRLLDELRRTRDHNPETLEAFERILQPEALNPYLSPQTPVMRMPSKDVSNGPRRHVAA